MKKNYSIYLAILSPIVFILFFAGILYHSGSPGGRTGSPGDNGATCTQCHTGAANPVENWISTDIPELGYVVGETYTITATGQHAGVGRFGFELTAEDASGNKVGSFNIINGQTQLSNGGTSVTHTNSGITPDGDSKTWTFEWTAPNSDLGIISFYGAFNAANNNGGTSGDVIYTSNMSVDESTIGIEDEMDIAEFSFGPNPSLGSINIKHDYNKANIAILDMSGKLVYEVSNIGSNQTLDIQELQSGVYFIQFVSGNALKTERFILK